MRGLKSEQFHSRLSRPDLGNVLQVREDTMTVSSVNNRSSGKIRYLITGKDECSPSGILRVALTDIEVCCSTMKLVEFLQDLTCLFSLAIVQVLLPGQ